MGQVERGDRLRPECAGWMWGAEQHNCVHAAHGLFITVGIKSERVKRAIHLTRSLKDLPPLW